MKKLLLVSLCFLLYSLQIFAQNRTVTGTVTAKEDGGPIPGATVKVKGTGAGTQTGPDGKYSLNVPAGANLVFSFIGYTPLEIPLRPGVINAVLTSASSQLGEVVVTGTLGRKFQEKSTGYASTHITANDLTLSAPVNFLNGLAGKVAGLQITQTGTGVDAGIKVQLRGTRSIAGNNQALIVVDGVPLPGGDISAIDPNTVESTDVLNGSSAAVLYGQEGSNGVILITTKKGSADGKPTVTYSNSYQKSQSAFYPKLQHQFGQYGGETLADGGIDPITGNTLLVPYENELYGPAFDGHTYKLGAPAGSKTGPQYIATYSPRSTDAVQDFFNKGFIEQNSVGINSGTSSDYFNLFYTNIINHGVTPSEHNNKNAFTVKSGKTYGIFKAEYNVTFTNSQIHQVGSDYQATGQSVNYALQQFPNSLNINDFNDPNGQFSNPNDYYSGYSTNPWWTVYNSGTDITRNIFQGNLKLTLSPTKYIDLSYNISDVFGTQESRYKRAEVDFSPYATSDPLGIGNRPSAYKATGIAAGQVTDSYNTGDGTNGSGFYPGYSRLQHEFYANLHPTLLKDFKTNLLLGAIYYNQHSKGESVGGTNLLVNGLYNITYNAGTPNVSESEATVNTLSFLGNLNLSYKDYLFLDASLRNDRDSRLAPAVQSFFYPGVNGAFVFTDAIPALKGNKILSFGKLRASYGVTSQVNVGPYNINDVFGVASSTTGGGFPYGGLGGLALGTTHVNSPIVPERNTEYEFGAELGFLDNRIHGSFSYYHQDDKNQTLNLTVSPSTGYSNIVTNIGEVQSTGWEASLTVSPLTRSKNKVGWDITANLANQNTKVLSILDNAPEFLIANNQYAIVGQQLPIIKGTDYQRDPNNGKVLVSPTTGLPLTATAQVPLGHAAPEWILGLQTTLSYSFISLNVVAEYRGGFVSQYAAASTYLFTGSSAYTVQNGRQRLIYPNSEYIDANGNYVANTNISTNDGNYKFWTGSAIAAVNSPYVTNGSYWKIREANLSFNLNKFVTKLKYVKGLKLALTGRNLIIWVPKTNFWGDPDVSASTNSNNGIVTSVNSVPAQRIFGAKLDVTF